MPNFTLNLQIFTSNRPLARRFHPLGNTFPFGRVTLSFFEPGMWFAGDFIADMSGNFYENYICDDEIKTFAKDVFGQEFEDENEEDEYHLTS